MSAELFSLRKIDEGFLVKVKLVEYTGIDHCHVGSVDGVHVLMIFFGCTALSPIFMIETTVEANALSCVPLIPTIVLIA